MFPAEYYEDDRHYGEVQLDYVNDYYTQISSRHYFLFLGNDISYIGSRWALAESLISFWCALNPPSLVVQFAEIPPSASHSPLGVDGELLSLRTVLR